MIRLFYGAPLELSSANGTEKQLNDCFRERFGLEAPETRRKAITFFLHAARVGGITLSTYFAKTRSGSGAPGTPRVSRKNGRKRTSPGDQPNDQTQEQQPPLAAPATSVILGNGGVVTLSANVNPLTLRGEDRMFFYKIVDAFEEFATSHPVATGAGVPETENQVSTS